MKKYDVLKIYRSSNTVFNIKDIAFIWKETDFDTVKARINYYVKTGKIYSPRRGLYSRDKRYNILELAIKIYSPAYVSLETVLQKEGIIFQYQSAVSVVSYLSREIVCDGHKYVFRKIKDEILCNHLGMERKENSFIASRERAFLDCVYLYQNYHFDNLKPLNWKICHEIAPILYGNKRLITSLCEYEKYA